MNVKVYSRLTDDRGRECIVMPAEQVEALLDIRDSLPDRVVCVSCCKEFKFHDTLYVRPDGLIAGGFYCKSGCYDNRYDNA